MERFDGSFPLRQVAKEMARVRNAKLPIFHPKSIEKDAERLHKLAQEVLADAHISPVGLAARIEAKVIAKLQELPAEPVKPRLIRRKRDRDKPVQSIFPDEFFSNHLK